MECGKAELYILTEEGDTHLLHTCFPMPGKNLPTEFKKYFEEEYVEMLMIYSLNEKVWHNMFKTLINFEDYSNGKSERRDKNEYPKILYYHLEVHDKEGRPYFYGTEPKENRSENIRCYTALLFVLALILI